MEKATGAVDVGMPVWVKFCMWAWINMQVRPIELLMGTPQPRAWVFVGRTDNGPRSIFAWEITEVWLN